MSEYWAADVPYAWQYPRPVAALDRAKAGLRIYETHIGMGTSEAKIGSYADFEHNVLRR